MVEASILKYIIIKEFVIDVVEVTTPINEIRRPRTRRPRNRPINGNAKLARAASAYAESSSWTPDA